MSNGAGGCKHPMSAEDAAWGFYFLIGLFAGAVIVSLGGHWLGWW